MLEKEQENVSTSEKQQNRWFGHQNKNVILGGGESFPCFSPTSKKNPQLFFKKKVEQD